MERTEANRSERGTASQRRESVTAAQALPPGLRVEITRQRLTAAAPWASAAKLTALIGGAGLGATVAVALDHPFGWILSVALTATVLWSLAFAEHEALHQSLFESRLANHAVGILCGALTLVPYSAYRSYHLQHHRATHGPGDTEPSPVLRSRLTYVLAIPVAMVGFSGELCYQLARSISGKPLYWAKRTRRPDLDAATAAAVVATPVLVVTATLLGHGTVVLLCWIVPAVLALIVGGLFVAAEHYGCAYGPGSTFEISRTVTTNSVARFLMWNGNLHTAHHLVPTVTGRNLPQLQRLIRDECAVVEASYWAFHRDQWRRIGRGEVPDPAPLHDIREKRTATQLDGASESVSA